MNVTGHVDIVQNIFRQGDSDAIEIPTRPFIFQEMGVREFSFAIHKTKMQLVPKVVRKLLGKVKPGADFLGVVRLEGFFDQVKALGCRIERIDRAPKRVEQLHDGKTARDIKAAGHAVRPAGIGKIQVAAEPLEYPVRLGIGKAKIPFDGPVLVGPGHVQATHILLRGARQAPVKASHQRAAADTLEFPAGNRAQGRHGLVGKRIVGVDGDGRDEPFVLP